MIPQLCANITDVTIHIASISMKVKWKAPFFTLKSQDVKITLKCNILIEKCSSYLFVYIMTLLCNKLWSILWTCFFIDKPLSRKAVTDFFLYSSYIYLYHWCWKQSNKLKRYLRISVSIVSNGDVLSFLNSKFFIYI